MQQRTTVIRGSRKAAPRQSDTGTPVEFFVGEIAGELGLGDSAAAKRLDRLLYRLVIWATAEGIPLERELVFDPDTVERFVEVALANDRSRATYRSILRSTAPKLTKRAPWEPRAAAIPRRQLAPPYRSVELQLLFDDAESQPTSRRRRGALALLLLGLGAGLDGRWVAKVSARDLEHRQHVVVVRVGDPSARSIVVRAEFEEGVLELAASAGEEFLIGGRSVSRNRTGHLVAGLHVPTGHPVLSPSRLRSTWLLSHLEAGTRLPELCSAAGLQGTAMFADLLPYVQMLSQAKAERILRGDRV